MTAVIYHFPAAGPRLEDMAAAPTDALTLVELAAARLGELADLVRGAAPGPEVTAAAEAVKALRGPLASLEITAEALVAARRAGEADARDARAAPPSAAARASRQRPHPGVVRVRLAGDTSAADVLATILREHPAVEILTGPDRYYAGRQYLLVRVASPGEILARLETGDSQ